LSLPALSAQTHHPKWLNKIAICDIPELLSGDWSWGRLIAYLSSLNGIMGTGRRAMLFKGRIRTLSQRDADGWLRREIIVQKDPNTGLPKVGDTWTLIDSDGDIYKLSFIKGANVSGYTCLGQPGKLKNWFLKHYPRNDVVKDRVVFRSTDHPNEYEIFSAGLMIVSALIHREHDCIEERTALTMFKVLSNSF